MEDQEKILRACNSGDQKARENLYKTYSRKMFGVCLHYSKDYTEAEDILQEGFYKVFKYLKQFKNQGSLEGWIRKIMVNTAIDKYQKQKNLYPVSEVFEVASDIGYDNIVSDISAKDLLNLIQELSPKYRMVFSLYAIDGYSHSEISEKLGISIGTSKSNLSRARNILQKKVVELFGTNQKKIRMI